MKKTLLLVASVLILVMTFTFFVSAERYVTVILDGNEIEFDVKAQIINGRTMVPLRKIFEAMGAEVDWEETTSTAIAKKNTRIVEAQIDNYEMYINGVAKNYDTAPMLLDGRTLVPVRFVAEAFGALVEWEDKTSTVTLTSPEKMPLSSFAEIKYQYDLKPYISIDKDAYIGVEYTELSSAVSTEDITEAVSHLVSSYVEYVAVERACALGDFVNIDFKGYVNGEELENAAAEDVELILGEGGYIPGFEEGIIDHKAGETFDVETTFPENYGIDELNGVKAVFKITLNSVNEVKYPELDDSFIARVTEYSTLSEYIEAVSRDIENEKKIANAAQQKNEVFSKVSAKAVISGYPKAEYDSYYNEYFEQFKSMASQYGIPFETFLALYAQTTVDEFEKYAKEYAQTTVEMELVFFSIANSEGIIEKLTRADYIAYIDMISKEYHMGAEEFELAYGINAIVKSLIYDEAMDFVIEKGNPV